MANEIVRFAFLIRDLCKANFYWQKKVNKELFLLLVQNSELYLFLCFFLLVRSF